MEGCALALHQHQPPALIGAAVADQLLGGELLRIVAAGQKLRIQRRDVQVKLPAIPRYLPCCGEDEAARAAIRAGPLRRRCADRDQRSAKRPCDARDPLRLRCLVEEVKRRGKLIDGGRGAA